MKRQTLLKARISFLTCGILFLFATSALRAEPSPEAVAAFNAYSRSVERRLAQQHRSAEGFLALSGPQEGDRLRRGEVILEHIREHIPEHITPASAIVPPGAMLHHWRGTAFAAGAKAEDFDRLMKDVNVYPQHFSPQVLQAGVLARHGDHILARMRVRQKHVITVVMDTTYDTIFGQLDVRHGYSISQSTRIQEIGLPGTAHEHALSGEQEHGFLWQLNTYWSYEERDGGLYMQIETISLTRSVPRGLGWVVGPYVESIPRESLQFTLQSACNAIRK